MELNEKKNGLSDLLQTSTEKLREMVNANTVVGEPITTPDGVTLIPVSRMSFGFGCGGSDYGKTNASFGGGAGGGMKVEPVAFIVVKDGTTRVLPVAKPAATTVDRVIDMVPDVMTRVENFIDKKNQDKDLF